jgi:DNA-directed RNA polymerase specialized sigma24 family protein
VFSFLGDVAAYARRRGYRDADAITAETMTIAWGRLADVPLDNPRRWLRRSS